MGATPTSKQAYKQAPTSRVVLMSCALVSCEVLVHDRRLIIHGIGIVITPSTSVDSVDFEDCVIN